MPRKQPDIGDFMKGKTAPQMLEKEVAKVIAKATKAAIKGSESHEKTMARRYMKKTAEERDLERAKREAAREAAKVARQHAKEERMEAMKAKREAKQKERDAQKAKKEADKAAKKAEKKPVAEKKPRAKKAPAEKKPRAKKAPVMALPADDVFGAAMAAPVEKRAELTMADYFSMIEKEQKKLSKKMLPPDAEREARKKVDAKYYVPFI